MINVRHLVPQTCTQLFSHCSMISLKIALVTCCNIGLHITTLKISSVMSSLLKKNTSYEITVPHGAITLPKIAVHYEIREIPRCLNI